MAIYDAVSELKADGCKIHTTNIALCAGMGALIAGAGTKGLRYSLPNARFLLQKTGMDTVFRGQATDIALEVANVKKWNEKINNEISRVTGQTTDRINEDLRRDFYLSSEEAVRYGLIDGGEVELHDSHEFCEELFNNCPNHITLKGYFQSEKYFINIEEDVRRCFLFNQNIVEQTKKWQGSKFKRMLYGELATALHIRRTDYLKHPDVYPQFGLEYYDKSYKNII